MVKSTAMPLSQAADSDAGPRTHSLTMRRFNIMATDSNLEEPKRRILIADELTKYHRFFPVPPSGFDPLKATDAQIANYGFPRRPDPSIHPRLHAQWERVMSRPFRVVTPELAVSSRGIHSRPSHSAGEAGPASNDHWSGAVTFPPQGDAFNTVSGWWIVPNANPPPSARQGNGWMDGTYIAVVWIGIDGWGVTGSTDVLQAGTGTQVTVSGGTVVSVSCFTWHEWWTTPWIVWTNVPVLPGDLVSCTVCAPSKTQGYAAFENVTTSVAASVGITPPQGVSLTGNCAEWIVERPSDGNGVPYTLPDYGATFFYDAIAGTPTKELNLGGATPINMVVGGSTISTAVEETSRVLMVYYGSNGP